MNTYYGICDCGKWGSSPPAFSMAKHFMKCPACGKAMYLTIHDPREAGHREHSRVTDIGLIPINTLESDY